MATGFVIEDQEECESNCEEEEEEREKHREVISII